MRTDCNIKRIIEDGLGTEVLNIEEIMGGDTGQAFKVLTTDNTLFCKTIHNSQAKNMLSAEASGLSTLAPHIQVPQVIDFLDSNECPLLLLEWLDFSISTNDGLALFGENLANLHRSTNDQFGLEQDNYIARLDQMNTPCNHWTEFYVLNRINPLIKILFDSQLISLEIVKKVDRLEKVLDLEIPNEKPSLLHGDLWSGNFMTTTKGTYVFDPAIYYGHREMDLAMSLLFGSFGRVFYNTYQQTFPLEKGFMERLDLHQLYPILVHSVMLEGHYIQKASNIIKKYS